MGQMVHLRVPEGLYKESEEFAEEFGFHSIQEYFRDAIRTLNENYKRQRALALLEKNFGKGAGKTGQLTIDDKKRIFLELEGKDNSHLLRGAGLD